MKRLLVLLVATLVVVGCSQAAPAPAPTTAPAAPKAAEPTKAAAAAPTQAPAPAKKVDFPQKGKAILNIIPYSAGGTTDIQARILGPLLEKDLGVPVEAVNKVGAGAQVGLTELVQAKPDGHTIGWTLFPGVQTIYLDPDRKAVFARKDFQPIAMHTVDPQAIVVKADSPYKTVKDLVDAAKANPGKVRISTAAILGDGHIGVLLFQQAVGARFTIVNFDGSPQAITEVLGGRVDACVQSLPNFTSQLKSGEMRVIGIMDKQQSPYAPGVKTLEEQGWKVYAASEKSISAPAGVPKDVVNILAASLKKAIQSPEAMQKMEELRASVRFMDADQLSARWDEVEKDVKALIDLAKQK